jgi:hypothetical protein
MAGMERVPVPAPVPVQTRIESTIRQAMASVPTVNGTTVNFHHPPSLYCGDIPRPLLQ